jgi:ubiquitin C-terminal hydrolase
VANAYATLMKEIWMNGHQHSSLSPTVLKRAIELFAPQFYGVQQQDSAEFLSYLLDALHEDLNRVRDPPYVVMPDVERGRKLTVCGAEVRIHVSAMHSIHHPIFVLSLKCLYCRHGKHSVAATLVIYSKTFMACTRVLVFVLNVRLCRSRLVSPVIIQNFHTLCTSRKYNSRQCILLYFNKTHSITLH